MKTKTLATAGISICLSTAFQLIPALYGEVFIFITMLSSLPIFIISKLDPRAGLLSLVATSLLVLSLSSHEALFFIFTNGPVGFSLGLLSRYSNNRLIISLGSGSILTIMLFILSFVINNQIFELNIPGGFLIEIGVLYLFCILYNALYLIISSYLLKFIQRFLY